MPASSSNTRAQTLPEWEEKRFILSADRSGLTAFAMEQKTSAILLPVRYLVMPNLFTNTAMGSESDWPSLFDQRKIRYAAQTGQMLT